jgi:hypothetical protein
MADEETLHLEREGLVEMVKGLIRANDRAAAQMVEVLRVLAVDMVTLSDLATPADALEAAKVRACRQRAERLLKGLGDDRAAN